MKYSIKMTKEAESNLEAIFFFIAQSNKSIAHRYLDELKARIKQLEKEPQLGEVYTKERRRLLHISHYIYYKINQKMQTIQIITIRHTSKKQLK